MKTTFQQLLDAIESRTGSGRKAADLLGIKQASYSQWRRGHSYPDDEQALKIAAELQLPPEHVLAAVRADRTTSREARRAWMKIAERFAAVMAYAAVGVSLVIPGFVIEAAAKVCILCQMGRAPRVGRRRDAGTGVFRHFTSLTPA